MKYLTLFVILNYEGKIKVTHHIVSKMIEKDEEIEKISLNERIIKFILLLGKATFQYFLTC